VGRIGNQESRIDQGLPVKVWERYLRGRCDVEQTRHVGLEEAKTRVEEQRGRVVKAGEGG